jgi:ribosome assembly protein RRB1
MSNMHKTQKNVEKDDDDDDDDEGSDSGDDTEEDRTKTPHLECAQIKHQGCVNRIRVSMW